MEFTIFADNAAFGIYLYMNEACSMHQGNNATYTLMLTDSATIMHHDVEFPMRIPPRDDISVARELMIRNARGDYSASEISREGTKGGR